MCDSSFYCDPARKDAKGKPLPVAHVAPSLPGHDHEVRGKCREGDRALCDGETERSESVGECVPLVGEGETERAQGGGDRVHAGDEEEESA